jgi:hypothetical protein
VKENRDFTLFLEVLAGSHETAPLGNKYSLCLQSPFNSSTSQDPAPISLTLRGPQIYQLCLLSSSSPSTFAPVPHFSFCSLSLPSGRPNQLLGPPA